MAFDYDTYVKGLIEKERALRDQWSTIPFKIKDLATSESDDGYQPDRSPFVQLYPEHRVFLQHHTMVQQHRMEYVRVANQGHHNEVLSTFVVLRTDESFLRNPSDYFGTTIEQVAKLCDPSDKRMGIPAMIPMILDPEQYLTSPDLRDLYAPVFRYLHSKGQGDIVVYANRLEDLLAMDLGYGSWTVFRQRQTEPFTKAGVGGIQLRKKGALPAVGIDGYLGERVAWLRLLKLNGFAQDIERLATEAVNKKNVGLARDIAFIVQQLFLTPIFYAHKTTVALHAPFDTSESLIQPLEKYVRYLEKRLQAEDEANAEAVALLMMTVAWITARALTEGQGITLPWFIAETRDALETCQDIVQKADPLFDMSNNLNNSSAGLVRQLGRQSKSGIQTTANELLDIRGALMQLKMERFKDVRNVTRVLVRLTPAAISLATSAIPDLPIVKRILMTMGDRASRLADSIDKLVDNAARDFTQPTHPMFSYRPTFRIKDLGKLKGKSPGIAV